MQDFIVLAVVVLMPIALIWGVVSAFRNRKKGSGDGRGGGDSNGGGDGSGWDSSDSGGDSGGGGDGGGGGD